LVLRKVELASSTTAVWIRCQERGVQHLHSDRSLDRINAVCLVLCLVAELVLLTRVAQYLNDISSCGMN
jgi:hypothetical protein